MVSSLNKKLLRDLNALKAQVFTIALVVSSAIAVFIGGFTTYDSLHAAQQHHYRSQQFSDIFAYAKRAPNALLDRIEKIPGVSQVEARLVYDVIIELPDMKEPAIGRFVSTPQYHLPRLNQLYLRRGQLITSDRDSNAVMVNESFANAHHLQPGDTLVALLNGKREQFTVAGIALSPEFVYAIRAQDLLPDDKHFGVFWINYKTLAPSFEMEGAFNSLVLKTSNTIPDQRIINTLDTLLRPYGGTGAFAKKSLLSNRFINNELTQLEFISLTIPTIFLAVAAFLLHIVAGRLIDIQRQHIATLKAVGYSNFSIGGYYLKFISVILFIGSVLGVIFGIWMGHSMLALYKHFFHFPVFNYRLQPVVPMIAIVISALAAISGTLNSIRYVIHLPPAEAMRPKSPPTYSRTLIDNIPFMQWLNPTGKTIIRYLSRQAIRSLMTMVGIAFAVAIIILSFFWQDSVRHIIHTQFLTAEREHMIIAFKDPMDTRVLSELKKLHGILAVEGFRSVPVRMKHAHYRYDTGLFGFAHHSTQRLILNKQLHPLPLLPHSFLLTNELAKRLHVSVGDTVTLDVLEGKRPSTQYTVTGLANDYIGLNAYMSLDTLNKLLDDGDVISGVNVLIDPRYLTTLYTTLKNLPKVATVRMKSALISTFNETFSRQILVFTAFFAGFAILIAIGIVYNTATIALAERSWELASLRVLGFTRHEVFKFLMGGLVVELIMGIPLGFVIGFGLASISTYLLPSEFVRLPLLISHRTLSISMFVILFTALLTSLLIRQRLRHLNLVAVLKRFD